MLTVLLFALLSQAPPKPVPAEIRLPEIAVPNPPPLPSPNAVQTLEADKYYVVDSDVECFVRTLPKGLLTVAVEAGPIKLPTKSLVEGGTTKFKTFKGKFIYLVEAVGTGRCELLIVPKGVAADKEIVQRSIDANTGPKPPPDPPPPKPDDIKSDPIWQSVSAIYGADQSAEKLTMARRLASVYRNAVTPALNWTPTVDDQRLTTFRELSDAMAGAAGAAGVPLPNLQPIREIFRRELLAKVGDGDASALTLDLRAKAKGQFTRFALILEALGQ